jgi:hypothetical protein
MTRRHPGRAYLADAAEPVPGPAGRKRGQQREDEEQRTDADQITLAEGKARDGSGEPGGQE